MVICSLGALAHVWLGSYEMKMNDQLDWTNTLTQLVLAIEFLEEERMEQALELGYIFLQESAAICQVVYEISDGDFTVFRALQSSHQLVEEAFSRFNRSANSSVSELCYSMYCFISTLSQQLVFGQERI